MSEPTPPTQPGQTVHGPQTNIAGGVTQYGGLFNTGIIQGNIVIPPPQPTLATPPAPPPDFVGRTEQLAHLAATLTAGRSAAITALQGMGGIGKTALAQQLAATLTVHFSGGIFWADLALHAGSAETILRAWGAFCGADLSQEPNLVVLSERVRALLAMRRAAQGAVLAVLDDVRAEWLTTARLLKQSLPAETPLLLTTRDIDLATALDADVVRLDVLSEENAYELLAIRVKPPTILTLEATVKALLQQLGYLPLAIRLVAGHVSKLARKPGFDLNPFVADVAQRAMSLLDAAGGSGLAATFEISYAALSAEQQRVFRYCSVFSPVLLTVEHMAGLLEIEPKMVEVMLDELVDVALLDWDHEQHGRYLLHPLLGQYSYDRLWKVEGVHSVHKRAAKHLQFLATARTRTPDECLAEVDQWEKAGEWAIFAERASALVGTLAPLGDWAGIDDRLVRAQYAVQTLPVAVLYNARLLHARGVIALKQGRWQESIRFGEQAAQTFKDLGDPYGLARTYGNLGLTYTKIGEWARAIELYQQDLSICEQLGDLHGVAQAYGNLGSVYYRQGHWTQAIELYQRSAQIKDQLQDNDGLAQIYNNQGNIYADKGERDQAVALYERAVELYEQQSNKHGLAQTYGNFGNVCYYQGDYDQAIIFLTQAEQIFAELVDPHGLAMVYTNLGTIYLDKGEWEQADFYFQKDLAIGKQLGDVHGLAQTYGNLAVMHVRQGDLVQASNNYNQSLQLFLHLGDLRGQAQTYNNLGNFYAARNAPQQALDNYARSIRVKQQVGDPHGIALTHKNLGAFYLSHDNVPLAAYYAACAALTFTQLQAPEELTQANDLLATILGSADAANDYLAALAQGKLPQIGGQSTLTLAHLLVLVTHARYGDHTLGERLYNSFQNQAVNSMLPRVDQAICKVLIRVLAGINNPDISALTAETARAVQSMLNQLMVK